MVAGAMMSMESRMEARKSESVESGSGGGDWPTTGVEEGSDVVATMELPVSLALP